MKHFDQIKKYDWADDYDAFQERFLKFAGKQNKDLTKKDLITLTSILVEEVTYLNNKLAILSRALVEVEDGKQDKPKLVI